MKRIKEVVKPWASQKRKNEDKELKEIEFELQIFLEEEGGIFPQQSQKSIYSVWRIGGTNYLRRRKNHGD